MLTPRILQIQNLLFEKKTKNKSDLELLNLIKELDVFESKIHNNYFPHERSELLIEMIVRPEGKNCETCGRTLKH